MRSPAARRSCSRRRVMLRQSSTAQTRSSPCLAAQRRSARWSLLLDRITTAYTGLAMDVEAASGDDDAKVVQNPVNIGSASQAWQFLQQPNGSYELRNANSGKCLSVYYNSTAAGAKLVQYDCHGWTDQQWQLAGMGGPTLAIQSVLSSYRVDVPGGTIAWNTQLQQWPSYRGYEPNQWFYLTPVNIAPG